MDFSSTKIRLSDAIRLGSALKPQGFDGYADHDESCAIVAACDALGIEPVESEYNRRTIPNYELLKERFPLLNTNCGCPVCDLWPRPERDLLQVIYHLNDQHRWDRLRIADFVEQIEQQSEPAGVVGEVVACK